MGKDRLSRAGRFVSTYALPLIVAVGAVLRFGTIATQGFWLDEQVTLGLIRLGPLELLERVPLTESNPPLFYLLAAGWERVFGTSEFAIRSFGALLGTLTIPVLYAATKSLSSRRAGLIAATLAATSPMLVWYAQELRNYGLFVFFAALAFLAFAKALEHRNQIWLWVWVITSALTLNTHYFAFFLIVPQFVWLLFRSRLPRAEVGLAGGALAVVGLALLPLLATQEGRGDWIDDYDLGGRLLQVPEHFLIGMQTPIEALPLMFVGLLSAVAMVCAWQARNRPAPGLTVAASVLAGSLALVGIALLAGADYVLSRNLIGLWIPFAAALAILLAGSRARSVGYAVTAALAAVGCGLVIWTAVTPAAQRPNYEELAQALPASPNHRLIVSQTSFSSPLVEYFDGLRFATDAELETRELVVIEPRAIEDYSVGVCWWHHTCGGRDLAPPPAFIVPDGFTERQHGSTELFDFETYEAERPLRIERPVEYFTPRVFVDPPD